MCAEQVTPKRSLKRCFYVARQPCRVWWPPYHRAFEFANAPPTPTKAVCLILTVNTATAPYRELDIVEASSMGVRQCVVRKRSAGPLPPRAICSMRPSRSVRLCAYQDRRAATEPRAPNLGRIVSDLRWINGQRDVLALFSLTINPVRWMLRQEGSYKPSTTVNYARTTGLRWSVAVCSRRFQRWAARESELAAADARLQVRSAMRIVVGWASHGAADVGERGTRAGRLSVRACLTAEQASCAWARLARHCAAPGAGQRYRRGATRGLATYLVTRYRPRGRCHGRCSACGGVITGEVRHVLSL